MNAIIPKIDITDAVWDQVCAIVLAAKDLQERHRPLSLQEALMLRDARDMLCTVDLDDMEKRMRG